MTNTPPKAKDPKASAKTEHAGMLGDGTEEQNLGQKGHPEDRIKKDDVDAAFGKPAAKK